MSDVALKNAHVRRDVLAARINKLNQELHDVQAEIRGVDEWISRWYDFAGDAARRDRQDDSAGEHSENRPEPEPVDPVDSERSERTRTTGNPKKEVVAAAVRKIIEREGEPVSRTDLYRLLNERGIVIEGKDPEQVLSTMLWRTRESAAIVRVPSGGYWLAGHPHAASGYEPDQAFDADYDRRLGDASDAVSIAELTESEARDRQAELTAAIERANHLYYNEDAPKLSDAEYDALRRGLDAIEARFPSLAKADQRVGSVAGISSPPPPPIDLDDELPSVPKRQSYPWE